MIAAIFLAVTLAAQAVSPTDSANGTPEKVSVYAGDFHRPPVLHWRVPLPGGKVNAASHAERSRPAFNDKHVFLGVAADASVYQLSRRDGTVVQTFAASASVQAEVVLGADGLFFSDSAGTTWHYALDGTLLWSHSSGSPILARPTLSDDLVIVTNVDDLTVALNRTTGTLVWQYRKAKDLNRQAELALFAAPGAVLTDKEVITGYSDGHLVALETSTGEVKWTLRVGEGRYPDLVATPSVTESSIFVAGYFQPLVALDRETHTPRWRVEAGAAASSALIEGPDGQQVLLHPGTDGTLRALFVVTGAEWWSWDSGSSSALSEPIVSDAGVFLAAADGGLYLLDSNTGTERWRFNEGYTLEGISAAPAIEGRQLIFVSNAGFLYSMIVPRPKTDHPTSDWPSWKRSIR